MTFNWFEYGKTCKSEQKQIHVVIQSRYGFGYMLRKLKLKVYFICVNV